MLTNTTENAGIWNTDTHSHHFNNHFPGKLRLAGCPLDNWIRGFGVWSFMGQMSWCPLAETHWPSPFLHPLWLLKGRGATPFCISSLMPAPQYHNIDTSTVSHTSNHCHLFVTRPFSGGTIFHVHCICSNSLSYSYQIWQKNPPWEGKF